MNDLYLKVIFTIIAICLILMTLRPILSPTTVTAYGKEIIDINIMQIMGTDVDAYASVPIPVEIRK